MEVKVYPSLMMFRWYLKTALSLQITQHTHGQHNVEIGLPCTFLDAVISSFLDVLFQNLMCERREKISLSFTGINSNHQLICLCQQAQYGGEEEAKITHNPELLTGMKLEEETVASLRRHPSLEGQVVTKGTHNPILPNSPTLPKMIFVALIHPHCCWMIQQHTEKTLQLTPPNRATPVNHYKSTLPVSLFRENQSRIRGIFVGPPKFQPFSLQS